MMGGILEAILYCLGLGEGAGRCHGVDPSSFSHRPCPCLLNLGRLGGAERGVILSSGRGVGRGFERAAGRQKLVTAQYSPVVRRPGGCSREPPRTRARASPHHMATTLAAPPRRNAIACVRTLLTVFLSPSGRRERLLLGGTRRLGRNMGSFPRPARQASPTPTWPLRWVRHARVGAASPIAPRAAAVRRCTPHRSAHRSCAAGAPPCVPRGCHSAARRLLRVGEIRVRGSCSPEDDVAGGHAPRAARGEECPVLSGPVSRPPPPSPIAIRSGGVGSFRA